VRPRHLEVEYLVSACQMLDRSNGYRARFGQESFTDLELASGDPGASVHRPELVQRRWLEKDFGFDEVKAQDAAIKVRNRSSDKAAGSRRKRASTNARDAGSSMDVELVDRERNLGTGLDLVSSDPFSRSQELRLQLVSVPVRVSHLDLDHLARSRIYRLRALRLVERRHTVARLNRFDRCEPGVPGHERSSREAGRITRIFATGSACTGLYGFLAEAFASSSPTLE
jgi:hypothetical protein